MIKKQDRVQMNEDIRVPEVRCVVDGGEALGIITIQEAMAKANELGLDLVLISPDAKPPVAKIMDYGKFRYETGRKASEVKSRPKLKSKRSNFRSKSLKMM